MLSLIFYGLFDNFIDCSHYPGQNNVYLVLPEAYHLFQVICFWFCPLQIVCQHRKNIEVPKHFMAFLRTFGDCSHYPCQDNVYLLLPSADICNQLKAIHNTTKYVSYLRQSHGEKSNCQFQMNICALRLIIGEHDPVDFIFTRPSLLQKY